MKHFSILIAALLLLANLSKAQEASQPVITKASATQTQPQETEQRNKAMLQMMQKVKEARIKQDVAQQKEQLALTDSQSIKYERIITKYADLRDELQRILAELRMKQTEEVKSILTPEQADKFTKNQGNSRSQMSGSEGRTLPPPIAPIKISTPAPVAVPASKNAKK